MENEKDNKCEVCGLDSQRVKCFRVNNSFACENCWSMEFKALMVNKPLEAQTLLSSLTKQGFKIEKQKNLLKCSECGGKIDKCEQCYSKFVSGKVVVCFNNGFCHYDSEDCEANAQDTVIATVIEMNQVDGK